MKLTIDHNIPDSMLSKNVVEFAQYFTQSDFITLRKMLADDASIMLYNKEQIDDADSVIGYFKDWLSRVADTFECEVRWSAQFSQAEVYFKSEKYKQVYILHFSESKIDRILLTPQSFSMVGFSIDDNPYNVGFVKANAPKAILPLVNHYFCTICDKQSKNLNWVNVVT